MVTEDEAAEYDQDKIDREAIEFAQNQAAQQNRTETNWAFGEMLISANLNTDIITNMDNFSSVVVKEMAISNIRNPRQHNLIVSYVNLIGLYKTMGLEKQVDKTFAEMLSNLQLFRSAEGFERGMLTQVTSAIKKVEDKSGQTKRWQ